MYKIVVKTKCGDDLAFGRMETLAGAVSICRIAAGKPLPIVHEATGRVVTKSEVVACLLDMALNRKRRSW